MSNESVQSQVRGHFRIFLGVLALAVVSGVATIVSDGPLIPVVLIIAAVQATLVLAFLMHAKSEGSWVRGTLAFCGVFLIVLFSIAVLAQSDRIEGTESISAPAAADEAEEH